MSVVDAANFSYFHLGSMLSQFLFLPSMGQLGSFLWTMSRSIYSNCRYSNDSFTDSIISFLERAFSSVLKLQNIEKFKLNIFRNNYLNIFWNNYLNIFRNIYFNIFIFKNIFISRLTCPSKSLLKRHTVAGTNPSFWEFSRALLLLSYL